MAAPVTAAASKPAKRDRMSFESESDDMIGDLLSRLKLAEGVLTVSQNNCVCSSADFLCQDCSLLLTICWSCSKGRQQSCDSGAHCMDPWRLPPLCTGVCSVDGTPTVGNHACARTRGRGQMPLLSLDNYTISIRL